MCPRLRIHISSAAVSGHSAIFTLSQLTYCSTLVQSSSSFASSLLPRIFQTPAGTTLVPQLVIINTESHTHAPLRQRFSAGLGGAIGPPT
eukprot:6214518-Pleurochrysis_carterae.AAC.1